jgi:hypothetical protein
MRVPSILVGIIVAIIAASPGFGQAVAEGAMVHANSAAAGAKVGSSIGTALSRANTRNAQKLHAATTSTASAGKIQYVPQSTTPATSAHAGDSSEPFVITSIRGARKPCTAAATPPAEVSKPSAPADPVSKAPVPAALAPVAPAAPPQSRDCGILSNPGESKSVINLSFPQ